MLRASVVAPAPASPGADFQALVDGADTPTTIVGVPQYQPTVGDRHMVQKVDGRLVSQQFLGRAVALQTAASTNQGMSIQDDAAGGVLKFWVGSGGAGYLNPDLADIDGAGHLVQPTLTLKPPTANGFTDQPYIRMWPGGTSTVTPVGNIQFAQVHIRLPGGGGQLTVSAQDWVTASNFVRLNANGKIDCTSDITSGNKITSVTAFVNSPGTTTNAANVWWNNSTGELQRVTSLRRYKVQRTPISLATAKGVLNLTPITWYDKGEYERAAGGVGLLRRIPGVTAEDVEKYAPDFATYDARGHLNGVAYDRIGVALIPVVRDLLRRVEALEEQQ